jgi:hypothetical protein
MATIYNQTTLMVEPNVEHLNHLFTLPSSSFHFLFIFLWPLKENKKNKAHAKRNGRKKKRKEKQVKVLYSSLLGELAK